MTKQQLTFLKYLTLSVFIGRAYQHLFFDIPLRALLWDEGLMKGMVESWTSQSWETYITNLETDYWIEGITQGLGVFYLIAALIIFLLTPKRKRLGIFLLIGSISLVFLAALYWKEKFQSFGQFIEYSSQFAMPFLLYFAIYRLKSSNRSLFINIAKAAVALTFIGHGLYALGFYPVPGLYVEMMLSVFQLSEPQAFLFLKVVGIIDLIAAIGIFIPKVQTPFLWYCVIWGTMTALARVVGNFYAEIPLESLHQWLYHTIYRLPHGGLPLFILWLQKRSVTYTNTTQSTLAK